MWRLDSWREIDLILKQRSDAMTIPVAVPCHGMDHVHGMMFRNSLGSGSAQPQAKSDLN